MTSNNNVAMSSHASRSGIMTLLSNVFMVARCASLTDDVPCSLARGRYVHVAAAAAAGAV